jgi:hypothetical protein
MDNGMINIVYLPKSESNTEVYFKDDAARLGCAVCIPFLALHHLPTPCNRGACSQALHGCSIRTLPMHPTFVSQWHKQ